MKTDIKAELKGRWSSVLISIGFPDVIFSGKHQPCIYCGGKDRARWDRSKEFYFCGQCGPRQPIDMAMDWLNMPYKETALYLRPNKENFKMTATDAPDTAKNEARLKKIHAGLQRITPDSIAAKYFAGRGITELPENDCYMHPGIDYYQDGKSIGKFPAIVSMFRNLAGETTTMHITYLSAEGKKLDVESPRKILPVIRPLPGSAIRLYPATDVLCVAEGIESALSVRMDTGMPVWAAGNANNMAVMEIPDSVKHIVIYADADSSYVGQKAAYTLAQKLKSKPGRESVTVVNLVDTQQVIDKGVAFDFNDYMILKSNA